MGDRNNGIDLVRLIGALFVIVLHTEFGALNRNVVESLRLAARWVVPFFFIAAGYFWNLKSGGNIQRLSFLEKRLSQLVLILFACTLIYLPLSYLDGDLKKFNHVEILLVGGYFHLWFVGSLLFGYIVIWNVYYLRVERFLLPASVVIVVAGVMIGSYVQLIGLHIGFDFARFLLSVPFMYFGILIHSGGGKKRTAVWAVAFVFGLALQYAEAVLLKCAVGSDMYKHQFLFGTILCSVAIFFLGKDCNIRSNLLSKIGKRFALKIYLLHPFVLFGLVCLTKGRNSNMIEAVRIFSPIVVFFVTLIIAWLGERVTTGFAGGIASQAKG